MGGQEEQGGVKAIKIKKDLKRIDRNNDHEINIDKNWDAVHIVNEENQNSEKNLASFNQDEDKKVMVKCWYCNKSFEKGTIYDEHYDRCYDNYAYLHM